MSTSLTLKMLANCALRRRRSRIAAQGCALTTLGPSSAQYLSATLKELQQRGPVARSLRNSFRVAIFETVRYPRFVEAKPWAGIRERFQRNGYDYSVLQDD